MEASLHAAVTPFFNFFTSALNMGTYFLVSHQNFITLFDLRVTDSSLMICTNKEMENEIMGVVQIDMSRDPSTGWDFEDCFVLTESGNKVSNILMIDLNNRIRFLSVRKKELQLSENFIQIPGKFKKFYKENRSNAILIIQNHEGRLFGIDKYHGSECFEIKTEGINRFGGSYKISFMPNPVNL